MQTKAIGWQTTLLCNEHRRSGRLQHRRLRFIRWKYHCNLKVFFALNILCSNRYTVKKDALNRLQSIEFQSLHFLYLRFVRFVSTSFIYHEYSDTRWLKNINIRKNGELSLRFVDLIVSRLCIWANISCLLSWDTLLVERTKWNIKIFASGCALQPLISTTHSANRVS